MSAFGSGFRRSFSANRGELSELLNLYCELLRGEIVGSIWDPNCRVDFKIEGITGFLHAEVKVSLDAQVLVNSFKSHLLASKKTGAGFTFLCVGDPPRRDPSVSLLKSFDDCGGWVGSDVEEPFRTKTIVAFKRARALFPENSLPRWPLLHLWQMGHVAESRLVSQI